VVVINFLLGFTAGVGFILAVLIVQSYLLDHHYRRPTRKRHRRG